MTVLLIAETAQGRLVADPVARALTALAPLGDVHVLAVGAEAAAEAATLSGVTKVLQAEGAPLPEALANLILSEVKAGGYTHVAAAATTAGKATLPRVAALLDVMIIPDVTAILDADTFERPAYAGNAVQRVRSGDAVKVLTLRTTGFAPAETGGPAPIDTMTAPADPALSTWVEDRIESTGRPELTSAGVVVSGGRGLGSEENFALIVALADKLGGAVGASRAAVDAGYAPNDWQVGQTGKVVAPDLYIAVGISGAIQHLAGMKDSKVIVALNKDEDAPIFQVADYGLVCDIFEAVPELTAKV
ncbi:electron transfer flavoprotein subunit alpha/FixB family protein [Falsirhodobacter halotolerans]|uniref:electron transfer flavoprotein subunit alpha/FixB family protein n=1 Tax=Falsirhodobacter halotolerans TaxID=1146892 RepID=UPI001FD23F97|nr:FAD-binding protein [Falsirhodobacter halotolerans]MCJ8138495.1 FAD-binding protein [Falsirhodobacter halotolerans]